MQTTTIDPTHLREVLGHYPTGVAVVTGTVDGVPVGMVVGTFSSVSLDPPLVSFMPQVGSGSWARLSTASALCVNVLAADQLELCRTLAGRREDKFADVAWSPSPLGAPALDDAVAQVHCRVSRTVEAGDHWIVLCAVECMEVTRAVPPLLFFQGGYGGFSPAGLAARVDADLLAAARLGDRARGQVERVARRLGCEAAALVAVSPDELTTVVSAYGGTATVLEPLGHRIPLIPPIGEAYVAGDPAATERWLAKVPSSDPSLVDRYRARLATVAARGVAISMVGPGARADYDRLHDALADYASGTLTPARERALRTTLAETRHFFDDVDLLSDETYDVGAIVVPVHDAAGRIVMVLRAAQLPASVPGRVVEEWVDELRAAARCVERDLASDGGARRASAYRDWYDGDFPM